MAFDNCVMDKQILYEKIRIAKAKRLLNNCYTPDVVEKADKLWPAGDEFVFTYGDHGINRLVFFAREWDSVNKLLELLDQGQYYLEFMTRNRDEYIPMGADLRAAMMRFSNPDCRGVLAPGSLVAPYKDSAVVEAAKESDAEEINELLWSIFHTEVSHLSTDDEMREKIRAEQVSVHRNEHGDIDALLQAEVRPKRFYINQIVNKTERQVIHAILLKRLEKYIEEGGRYLYAWVEAQNIASLKFHEKYGLKHDGMWSMIYSVKR